MPGPKRNRRERTEEWASIKQWTLWPEQELYEQIRPLVLFHETAGERAKEIDVPQRTLSRKADAFERSGMASLFPSGKQGGERETSQTLPEEVRQLIVELHDEAPSMSWREIADICYIRYDRKPSHHSIKRVATTSPSPRRERRYQPWHLIADPAERKLAVIWLHSEGWSVTSIADYLQTTRQTVYDTLKRWADEGVEGLDAKPKTNKGVRKATLKVRNEIRKLQENPLLGEYRVHTALLRMGIEVSPATCGRIMAANRQLYGLQKPPHSSSYPKREMPFKAERRHQYWCCDVRYIEEHLLPDPKPVYIITVFESFSRMVLSSKISATQNQWDYLSVLVDAIRRYGAPEAIVTDGGLIFTSNMALELYQMLDIRKEQIESGQPWQNYAETLFSIQRRLGDHDFSNARTWSEMQRAHRKWWINYNVEHHQAHQKRQDGRHSPVEVLRGMLGRTYPEEVLARVLYATQFTRHLDRHGYVRFKHWRFFGEDGLAGSEVSVWMYEGTLKIEYQTTALSEYTLSVSPDHRQIQAVKSPRRIETQFVSPQLHLWQRSETEWLLALKQPERHPRNNKRTRADVVQLQLPEIEQWRQA